MSTFAERLTYAELTKRGPQERADLLADVMNASGPFSPMLQATMGFLPQIVFGTSYEKLTRNQKYWLTELCSTSVRLSTYVHDETRRALALLTLTGAMGLIADTELEMMKRHAAVFIATEMPGVVGATYDEL